MKNILEYTKNCIPGYVLCVLISCSVAFTVLSGFYISEDLQYNYALLVILSAVLTALCTAGAYSRRTVAGAIITFALAFIIFVAAARGSGGGNIFRDAEDNPYLYFIIVAITVVLVYLATRRRWSCGLLFVAGSVTLSGIQFLYETEHVPALILFLVSCGAMYIFTNYEHNVLRTATAKTAFGRTFATSIAVSLLVVVLGLGAYLGIVRALDPPAHELKLITKYMALETWQKMGIADYNEIMDEDLRTSREEEEARRAQQESKEEDQRNSGDKKEENQDKNDPTTLDSSNTKGFYVVSYLRKWVQPWMIPLLILLILAGLIFGKKYQRRRWLDGVRRKERNEQIRILYLFFLRGMGKLKIRRKPTETLPEYLSSQHTQLKAFTSDESAFEDMTRVYMDTVYGEGEASEGDLNKFLDFYRAYYANCRTYLGNVRYAIRFLIL